jgi:branched-chain amino acid transport system permease protein
VEIFLDRLFYGITSGAIYSLVALALVIVFRSSSTINFAQGEFALFCCFVAWWLNTRGVPMVAALFVAMAIGFGMGVVVERGLIRPVRRRSENAVLIIGLGLFIARNWIGSAVAVVPGVRWVAGFG